MPLWMLVVVWACAAWNAVMLVYIERTRRATRRAIELRERALRERALREVS